MQGSYNYITETNHVSRVYSVGAVLYLPFTCNVISPVKYVLYFYIGTFYRICALHNMIVFCISLISCFPGMVLSYFLSNFEMFPFTSIITGITFAFAFHICRISVMRSLKSSWLLS